MCIDTHGFSSFRSRPGLTIMRAPAQSSSGGAEQPVERLGLAGVADGVVSRSIIGVNAGVHTAAWEPAAHRLLPVADTLRDNEGMINCRPDRAD